MSKNGRWRKKNATRSRPAPEAQRDDVVRTPAPEDREGILDLLHAMHAENGLAPIDDAKVEAAVSQAMAGQMAVCGVIGPVGKPEATIGVFVCEFWYSSALHLEDRWNFVHPDHRAGTLHAANLLAFAKWTRQRVDHLPLMLAITSASRTEAKVRLYQRQMGDPIGAIFWLPAAGRA